MEPVPLADCVADSTPELDDLLLRCLSKQPAIRPAAGDVARRLAGNRLVSLHIPRAEPPPPEAAPIEEVDSGPVIPTRGDVRFVFTTLGSTDLKSTSGDSLTSVLSQPKRVALLAYLGMGGRGGFVRRDTLLALFWPSATSEKARHSLRQSIYVLRRAFGPDVIVSRGDDELGLAPGVISFDASFFEELVENDEFAKALEVYSGDFLPGFYVPDAADFEYWLHSERQRLRDLASRSSWSIALGKEKEGDTNEAASWGRKAAELAPFDEALLRELISLLERLGDRVGAMQAYDRFAERLRAEYEMEPAPETRELAATLKSGAADGPESSD